MKLDVSAETALGLMLYATKANTVRCLSCRRTDQGHSQQPPWKAHLHHNTLQHPKPPTCCSGNNTTLFNFNSLQGARKAPAAVARATGSRAGGGACGGGREIQPHEAKRLASAQRDQVSPTCQHPFVQCVWLLRRLWMCARWPATCLLTCEVRYVRHMSHVPCS